MLNLFSSLGGIIHTSLPGESAERVVKSRKHPELTLPVLRQLIMLFGADAIFSICLELRVYAPVLSVCACVYNVCVFVLFFVTRIIPAHNFALHSAVSTLFCTTGNHDKTMSACKN